VKHQPHLIQRKKEELIEKFSTSNPVGGIRNSLRGVLHNLLQRGGETRDLIYPKRRRGERGDQFECLEGEGHCFPTQGGGAGTSAKERPKNLSCTEGRKGKKIRRGDREPPSLLEEKGGETVLL